MLEVRQTNLLWASCGAIIRREKCIACLSHAAVHVSVCVCVCVCVCGSFCVFAFPWCIVVLDCSHACPVWISLPLPLPLCRATHVVLPWGAHSWFSLLPDADVPLVWLGVRLFDLLSHSACGAVQSRAQCPVLPHLKHVAALAPRPAKGGPPLVRCEGATALDMPSEVSLVC